MCFTPQLRTPTEWSARKHLVILDPDGWREDGKSMLDLISEQEFDLRAALSTTTGYRTVL